MNRVTAGSTSDRILKTYLRLVVERGIDATTTRLLAEEAGVNEVTIFRLFGDKATLTSRAVQHFQLADGLADYALRIDASSPTAAATSLVETLTFLRQRMLERPEFMQFGIAEYWRLPQLKDALATSPRAGRELVERALGTAAPVLRPGLDLRAASLSLVGLLFVSVVWPSRGWIAMSDDEWRAAVRQAVEVLLREPDSARR